MKLLKLDILETVRARENLRPLYWKTILRGIAWKKFETCPVKNKDSTWNQSKTLKFSWKFKILIENKNLKMHLEGFATAKTSWKFEVATLRNVGENAKRRIVEKKNNNNNKKKKQNENRKVFRWNRKTLNISVVYWPILLKISGSS